MYARKTLRGSADLDQMLHHVRCLQHRDLSAEAEHAQAMRLCLRLLGAIGRYRHLLKQMDAWTGRAHRHAA